jgi:hypothetical protein
MAVLREVTIVKHVDMRRAHDMCADCVVCWHNPPLPEIAAHPIVPRTPNTLFLLTIC